MDSVRSIFKSSANERGALDNRESSDDDEECHGLIKRSNNAVKGIVSETSIKISTALDKSTKEVKKISTEKNYYVAGCLLALGGLFLLIAMTLLPLILISPNKFNTFFSIGSTLIQLSLAFFYGPIEYFKILFKKEYLLISIIYVTSLALAIYSSLLWGTYISGLLILMVQVRHFSLLNVL